MTPSAGANVEVTPSVDANTKISVVALAIAVWLYESADEHAHTDVRSHCAIMVSGRCFTRETFCRRRWIWFEVRTRTLDETFTCFRRPAQSNRFSSPSLRF